MARIDSFLELVADQRASDLHLHSGNPPIIRHDGTLLKLPFRELTDFETERLLTEILDEEQQSLLADRTEVDTVYELENVARFRVNVFVQKNGLGAVFRVIPEQIPTLDELLLPDSMRRLMRMSNGLILVTGPTGSGKTTTLAALVNEMNHTQQRHIITIEDPIEFMHESRQCLITQRQVGKHAETFAGALRSALREAPDVIVVGEMRDLETISLALSASETGVLVFGTLHTNSASKAVNRIIDAYPEDAREHARVALATLLRGVVAQSLCKKATGDGRLALTEVLFNNTAIATMIREAKLHQIDGFLQTANTAETGMQSMDKCALEYVRERLITAEEAIRYANDVEYVRNTASKILGIGAA